MGNWYIYPANKLPFADRERLTIDIPGVRLTSGDFWAPENAAWLVEEAVKVPPRRIHPVDTEVLPFKAGTIDDQREEIYRRVEATGLLRGGITQWLFQHQVQGVADLAAKDGALALYGCGLGKTATSIVWSILHPGLTVVTTTGGVRRQFGREIDRLLPTGAIVLTPGKEWTLDELQREIKRGCRHIVCGIETLPRYIDLILALKPHSWIADEIQKLKSRKRFIASSGVDGKIQFDKRENIAAAAYDLSRATKRRMGLTATLIANRLEDAWGQLDLLEPGQWGPFWRETEDKPPYGFAVRFCDARRGQWGGVDSRGISHISEFIRRLSLVAHMVDADDVRKDLPMLTRECPRIGPEEQVKATGFTADFRKAAKNGAAALREVFLAEAAARKKRWVYERIEDAVESGQKICIVTGRHTDCAKLVADLTQKFGKRTTIVDASGGLTPAQREAAKDAYLAAPGGAILVGTLGAWSTGIDGLQKGTQLVLCLMLPWRLSDLEQFEGRFNRPGQMYPVIVVYPICVGSYDEKIAALLYDKLDAVVATAATGFSEEFKRSMRGNEAETLASIIRKINSDDDPLKGFWTD